MTVCEVIIDEGGNPRMRALGADMKRMLEGKCCVCSCIHVRTSVCICELVCVHNPIYIITIHSTNCVHPVYVTGLDESCVLDLPL